jgi:glycerol-3-phosphate acyltransferase PlsY
MRIQRRSNRVYTTSACTTPCLFGMDPCSPLCSATPIGHDFAYFQDFEGGYAIEDFAYSICQSSIADVLQLTVSKL